MLATERVRTEHNCVPRDIVPMRGNKILLGYQVFMGLKSRWPSLMFLRKSFSTVLRSKQCRAGAADRSNLPEGFQRTVPVL